MRGSRCSPLTDDLRTAEIYEYCSITPGEVADMKKFTRDIKTAFTVSLLVFLTGMSQTTVAQINLPDLPLPVGSSVRPNIFFMLDDSRSMVHEVVWNDVDAGATVTSFPLYGRSLGGRRCP